MVRNRASFGLILLVTCILFTSCHIFQGESLQISEMKVEFISEPVGLDVEFPRFSWVPDSKERSAAQSAYRILVSNDPEKMEDLEGDLWDSGKVMGSETIHIRYEGPALQSNEDYYWRVHLWDELGKPSGWSDVQQFSTGLIHQDEWIGKWISHPDSTVSAPLLRTEFDLDKPLKSATAFVSGAGYYELYLNGVKVGDHVLDPALTDFRKRILYETYDVTELLRSGKNGIGFWLGNGALRVRDTNDRWTWHRMDNNFGKPMGLLQIHIRFEDGTEEVVVTDRGWKGSQSPLTYNNVYGGEDYDARLEQEGWSEPGFDDAGWVDVTLVDDTGLMMDSQMMPPIRVVETIEPLRSIRTGENKWLYDLGQNIPGWWKVSVTGEEGTELRIRGAETLNDQRYPKDLAPGDSLSSYNQYHRETWTDYTLKGGGQETYEPRFFYTGFRYIEVSTDQPETIQDLRVEGRVVHTDLERTGHFESSDTLFNRIYEASVWAQRGNLHGFPTDCPHREKGGYTGDGQVIAETSMHDFQMHAFYEKWLNDMRDAQQENGRIPNTAPTLLGGMGGGIAWGSAYILIPWWIYQYYGDRTLLEEHYPAMKDYMEYLEELAATDEGPERPYIIDEFGGFWDSLGEWEAPVGERTGPVNPLTNTYYWYLNARTFAKISDLLGHDAERGRYLDLADSIREAFNREFFIPELNLYGTEEPYQSYLLFALSGEMVPEDHRGAVLNNLIQDIMETRNGHLGTGILGTKHLVNFLPQNGFEDVLHTITSKRTYPSWGYWIENGATTLWESWDGDTSHNHQMFGMVSEYFYKYLAGIRSPADGGTTVSYKHIHIEPYLPEGVDWVRASVNTVRGRVSSVWEKSDDYVTLEVEIPANTTGTIILPTQGWEFFRVTEDEKTVWDSGVAAFLHPHIQNISIDDNSVILDIDSGKYRFKLKRISGL